MSRQKPRSDGTIQVGLRLDKKLIESLEREATREYRSLNG